MTKIHVYSKDIFFHDISKEQQAFLNDSGYQTQPMIDNPSGKCRLVQEGVDINEVSALMGLYGHQHTIQDYRGKQQ